MSKLLQTIFKNTFWLSFSEVVNGVLMFFVTIWLARYLGASIYGQLMFAISLTTLFSVFTDIGLSTLLTREIAREKILLKKYLDNIISIKVFLSIVTIILIFISVIVMQKDVQASNIIYLMSLWIVFSSFSSIFQAVFRAFEKMEYEALVKIVYTVSLFLSVLLVIKNQLTVINLSVFYILSIIISAIAGLTILIKKFTIISFRFDWMFVKKLLRESWPFALSAIFIMIYYYMDSVMLGVLGQDKEVGWYNAAYRPIMFLIMLSGIISTSFFPVISRLYKESIKELENLLSNYSKLILFISMPIAFGGTILANDLILLLFGTEYINSVLAFQILIWTVAVIFISSIYGPSLQACDRQKIHLFGVGTGAVVNIILNFILIPLFSLYGAAVATLLSELVVVIYMSKQLNKVTKVEFSKYIWKPLLSSMIMSLIILLLYNFNVVVLIIIGIVVYGLMMLITGGVKKSDIFFIRDLLSKRIV